MNKLLLSLVLLSSAGCYKYGPTQTEEGRVSQQLYHPAQEATAIGMSTSRRGNLKTTVSTVYIPASYGVVFQCSHGQFAISGSTLRDMQLWEKLPTGTPVLIEYRVRYNFDGSFNSLDFLDANPRDVASPAAAPLGDYALPSKNLG
jgi:hypothetical protein